MEELKLKTLLQAIDLETRVEIVDSNYEIKSVGTVSELFIDNDTELLKREVLRVNPQHTSRENYIEIMIW